MAVPYHLYQTGQFAEWQLVTLLRIEAALNVDISYEEATVFPINRIAFKNLSVKDRDNQFEFELEEMELYYDLRSFLANFFQEDLRFDLAASLANSVSKARLVEPVIDLSMPEQDFLKFDEVELDEPTIFDPDDIWEALPVIPAGTGIVIEGGSINYDEGGPSINIKPELFELIFVDERQVQTNFSGEFDLYNFEIEKIIYEDEEWEELLLPELTLSGDLAARLNGSSWNLNSNFMIPAAGQFNRWADRIGGSFGLSELELYGSQTVNLSMTGDGNGLIDLLVQGETDLSRINFKYEEMAEPLDIQRLRQNFSFSLAENQLLIPELEFSLFEDEEIRVSGQADLTDIGPEVYLDLETGTEDLYKYLNILADNNHQFNELKEQLDTFLAGAIPVDIKLSGGYREEDLWLEGDVDISEFQLVDSEINYDGSMQFAWQDNELQLSSLNIADKIIGNGYFIPETEEYSFDLELNQLRYATIKNFIEQDLDFIAEDEISGELFAAGKGFDLGDLVLSGQLLAEEINIYDLAIDRPLVNFWLKDNYLEVGPVRGESSAGKFDFAGGINLETEEIDLELILDDLVLGEISGLAGIEQGIQGDSRVSGSIAGSLSEPVFDLELWLSEAEFFGVEVSDGHGHLNYSPGEELLYVENLDFTSRTTDIIADGQLDFSPIFNGDENLPLIDARLDINELTYEYINEIFGISLPLIGDVSGYVELDGRLNAPTVNASARSRSTSLPIGDEYFEFENSRSDFYWSEGEPFQVIDLRMEKEEAVFVIDYGEFSDNFYVDYAFNDYRLSRLDSSEFDNFRGRLSASGEAGGSYDNPWGYADLEVVDLIYDGYDLGRLTGQLELEEGDLLTEGISWEPGSGDFIITGKVDNILNEAELDLQVAFDDVDLPYYIESFGLDVPPLEYYFSGELEVTGDIDDWLIAVDVDADSDVSDLGRLNLLGWIGEEYDLSLVGIDLGFDWLCGYLGPDVDIDGDLELIGTVYGPLDGPEVDLETTIRGFQINQYSLSQISGRVSGDVQNSLTVEQELIAATGEDIRLDGVVNIPAPEESNFQLRARDFPLNPVAGFFPEVDLVDGRLDGEVDFRGSLENPDLDGQLYLSLDELNFGQTENLSLDGYLDFIGDRIELSDMTGNYDGGSFELTGLMNIIDQANFWDLELIGDSIPIEYAGSSAVINGGLTFSGPLYEPVIGGEITVNDLMAVVPEDFEPDDDVDDEFDPFEEARFQPEIDLRVRIGNNNMFSHENAEIPIQRGDLRLLYQDEFQIDGQISSNQGTIFFYNNRFNLDSARLNFRRRQGIIPTVTVRASTRAEGNDIFVRLDGLATDLNLSFASDPEMEEEEILALLARRGGIGGALVGEDLNVFQIVQQEFFRFLSDTFQLEIVGNIQREIRRAFELDRFEIVTHELGWDQEVSLHIGKDLTDRLYIEGSSRIRTDEQDTEISFKYDITDRTVLDGTIYGPGEFSLSIETMIEF